jgi:hypothetical protein
MDHIDGKLSEDVKDDQDEKYRVTNTVSLPLPARVYGG